VSVICADTPHVGQVSLINTLCASAVIASLRLSPALLRSSRERYVPRNRSSPSVTAPIFISATSEEGDTFFAVDTGGQIL
jgi:hypothetical protein